MTKKIYCCDFLLGKSEMREFFIFDSNMSKKDILEEIKENLMNYYDTDSIVIESVEVREN